MLITVCVYTVCVGLYVKVIRVDIGIFDVECICYSTVFVNTFHHNCCWVMGQYYNIMIYNIFVYNIGKLKEYEFSRSPDQSAHMCILVSYS